MLWPSYQQAVFALDPAAGLTDGNLWKDSGPNGFDWTPNANYAAPAYGIAPGPSGAPYIGFNGANQYGTLAAAPMARFYATCAGVARFTVAIVARHNAPAANDIIFNTMDGGGTRGLILRYLAAERLFLRGLDAAAAASLYALESTDASYTSRTRVTILSAFGADAYGWVDGVQRTMTFPTAGNGNAVGWNAAIVPTVGAFSGGGFYFDGDLYFLGIWPLIFTDSEARAFSAYWMDRT